LESEWHEYKLTEGSVYVRIHRGDITAKGGYAGEPKREVIEHRVDVSTTPSDNGDAERGYLAIRGRKYSIEQTTYKRVEYKGLNGIPQRWSVDYKPYSGGSYRNDKGFSLDRGRKTHDRLDELVCEVLDLFELDHPEWRRTSERLALEAERSSWAGKARDARREAEEADQAAAKWQQRIAELDS
jgi:hypothetical protein